MSGFRDSDGRAPDRGEHPPKIAALVALREGALSAAGADRIRRHLAGCSPCRRALAAIEAYEVLLEDLDPGLPRSVLNPGDREEEDAAWARLARALPRRTTGGAGVEGAARHRRRRRNARLAGGAVVLAAAATALLVSMPEGRGGHHRAAVDDGEPPTGAAGGGEDARRPPSGSKALAMEAVVVAGSLDATVDGVALGSLSPGAPQPRVPVGAVLAVPEDEGFLDVVIVPQEGLRSLGLAPGPAEVPEKREVSGFRVAATSRVVVDALEESGSATLRVLSGAVVSQVGRQTDGAVYTVRAGAWEVRVRGTRFSVSATPRAGGPTKVEVVVEEGSVEVGDGKGAEKVLSAPERWTSPGSEATASGSALPVPPVPGAPSLSLPWLVLAPPLLGAPPVGLRDATSGPSPGNPGPDDGSVDAPPYVFDLPGAPGRGVANWALGSLAAPGAPARLWARPETLRREQIVAIDHRGRRHALAVGDEGGRIPTPTGLSPRDPVRRMGTLPPEVLREVVSRGRRRLRQCYSRALRTAGDAFSADLRLELRIARTGEVRQSEARSVADGAPPPAALLECVEGTARGWSFPQPEGGPVDVEIPIRFDAPDR